jgi:hypothetical protein
MDRALLLRLLARAEHMIALGKERIDKQYRIIAELESEGHDTTDAMQLLKEFVDDQELREQEHDSLASKLAGAG